jgi:hypothetical protein
MASEPPSSPDDKNGNGQNDEPNIPNPSTPDQPIPNNDTDESGDEFSPWNHREYPDSNATGSPTESTDSHDGDVMEGVEQQNTNQIGDGPPITLHNHLMRVAPPPPNQPQPAVSQQGSAQIGKNGTHHQPMNVTQFQVPPTAPSQPAIQQPPQTLHTHFVRENGRWMPINRVSTALAIQGIASDLRQPQAQVPRILVIPGILTPSRVHLQYVEFPAPLLPYTVYYRDPADKSNHGVVVFRALEGPVAPTEFLVLKGDIEADTIEYAMEDRSAKGFRLSKGKMRRLLPLPNPPPSKKMKLYLINPNLIRLMLYNHLRTNKLPAKISELQPHGEMQRHWMAMEIHRWLIEQESGTQPRQTWSRMLTDDECMQYHEDPVGLGGLQFGTPPIAAAPAPSTSSQQPATPQNQTGGPPSNVLNHFQAQTNPTLAHQGQTVPANYQQHNHGFGTTLTPAQNAHNNMQAALATPTGPLQSFASNPTPPQVNAYNLAVVQHQQHGQRAAAPSNTGLTNAQHTLQPAKPLQLGSPLQPSFSQVAIEAAIGALPRPLPTPAQFMASNATLLQQRAYQVARQRQQAQQNLQQLQAAQPTPAQLQAAIAALPNPLPPPHQFFAANPTPLMRHAYATARNRQILATQGGVVNQQGAMHSNLTPLTAAQYYNPSVSQVQAAGAHLNQVLRNMAPSPPVHPFMVQYAAAQALQRANPDAEIPFPPATLLMQNPPPAPVTFPPQAQLPAGQQAGQPVLLPAPANPAPQNIPTAPGLPALPPVARQNIQGPAPTLGADPPTTAQQQLTKHQNHRAWLLKRIANLPYKAAQHGAEKIPETIAFLQEQLQYDEDQILVNRCRLGQLNKKELEDWDRRRWGRLFLEETLGKQKADVILAQRQVDNENKRQADGQSKPIEFPKEKKAADQIDVDEGYGSFLPHFQGRQPSGTPAEDDDADCSSDSDTSDFDVPAVFAAHAATTKRYADLEEEYRAYMSMFDEDHLPDIPPPRKKGEKPNPHAFAAAEAMLEEQELKEMQVEFERKLRGLGAGQPAPTPPESKTAQTKRQNKTPDETKQKEFFAQILKNPLLKQATKPAAAANQSIKAAEPFIPPVITEALKKQAAKAQQDQADRARRSKAPSVSPQRVFSSTSTFVPPSSRPSSLSINSTSAHVGGTIPSNHFSNHFPSDSSKDSISSTKVNYEGESWRKKFEAPRSGWERTSSLTREEGLPKDATEDLEREVSKVAVASEGLEQFEEEFDPTSCSFQGKDPNARLQSTTQQNCANYAPVTWASGGLPPSEPFQIRDDNPNSFHGLPESMINPRDPDEKSTTLAHPSPARSEQSSVFQFEDFRTASGSGNSSSPTRGVARPPSSNPQPQKKARRAYVEDGDEEGEYEETIIGANETLPSSARKELPKIDVHPEIGVNHLAKLPLYKMGTFEWDAPASQAQAAEEEDLMEVDGPAPSVSSAPTPVVESVKKKRSALEAFGIDADIGELLRKEPTYDPEDRSKQLRINHNAPRPRKILTLRAPTKTEKKPPFHFFENLAQYPELVFELAKQCGVKDLLSIYAISKDVNELLNGHLLHVAKLWTRYHCPLAASVFKFGLYKSLCRPDPVKRPHPSNWALPRYVPSFKYFQMVSHRQRTVRDILALMARDGHRMPKGMDATLMKIWLIMDVATSRQRMDIMRNEEWFTDQDCYNTQLFIIKLDLRFNEPLTNVGDDGLRKIMLGQRGLTPLKKLLAREDCIDEIDVIRAAVRYCWRPTAEYRKLPVFAVRPEDIGKGHLEGWGQGRVHLWRVDELVMRESVRRRLDLDNHLLWMMLWGYVDPVTKKNIKPSDEELYMSDEDDQIRKWLREKKAREKAAKEKLKATGTAGTVESEEDEPKDPRDMDVWANIRFYDETWSDDEDFVETALNRDEKDAGQVGPSGWRRPERDNWDEWFGDEDDDDNGDGGDDQDDDQDMPDTDDGT